MCAPGPIAGDGAFRHQGGMNGAHVIANPVAPVEWRVTPGLTPYPEAMAAMQAHVVAVAAGDARERIWLLQHPAVITAGTSAKAADLLDPGDTPVIASGRGGQYTLHAPGQRVIYIMLDLNRRGRDVRRLVSAIEAWLITALADLDVRAFASPLGTGIWIGQSPNEAKIGAIGIRVSRGITLHGAAVNISTDLSRYRAIVPCGISDHGVARLADIRPDLAADALAMLFDAALEAGAAAFLSAISGHEPT